MKCAKFACVPWPMFHYFIIFTYQVPLKNNLYLPTPPQKKGGFFKNSLQFFSTSAPNIGKKEPNPVLSYLCVI